MADEHSKKPEPKPGEILPPGRNWSDEEVAEMKVFIDANERGLWEQLVAVERTTGDFRGLEIARRTKAFIIKKFPNAGRTDHITMWAALRRNWSRTVN